MEGFPACRGRPACGELAEPAVALVFLRLGVKFSLFIFFFIFNRRG